MEKVQKKNSTRIVGLSIETGGPLAAKEIGELWANAYKKGVFADHSAATFGVYYAYQDAQATRYRVLVGQESDTPAVDGLEEILIPQGTYGVLKDKGPVAEKVPPMWEQAWSTMQSERTMNVDFERYLGGPDNAEIELFVSL